MHEGGQKVPKWLLLVIGLSTIPLLALLYQATQSGRPPKWLMPTAAVCFLTPMTLLGLYLIISFFRVKADRRSLLEDLEFDPIDRDALDDIQSEFLTASQQRIVPIGAKLIQGWSGLRHEFELELYEFRYTSGNHRFTAFLVSATALPPAGQVCIKRSLVPCLSWVMPNQQKGIAPKHMRRKWLIYGDKDSAQHFLSDLVCTFLEQLPPKFKLMIFWSNDKLYVGTTGSLTREGVEYLLALITQLQEVAQIRPNA